MHIQPPQKFKHRYYFHLLENYPLGISPKSFMRYYLDGDNFEKLYLQAYLILLLIMGLSQRHDRKVLARGNVEEKFHKYCCAHRVEIFKGGLNSAAWPFADSHECNKFLDGQRNGCSPRKNLH